MSRGKYSKREKNIKFDGGGTIRKYLNERYLTQKEFATLIGIHPARLNEIINGIIVPKPIELVRIKDHLGIDLNEWRAESRYVCTNFPVAGYTFEGEDAGYKL